MTIDNVTAGTNIDPDWGNAVADQLNDLPTLVQSGVLEGTSDANGDLALTFPQAFAADPVVVATRRTPANAQMGVHIVTVSTTGVTFTCTSNDAVQTNVAGIDIHWVAIGAPA